MTPRQVATFRLDDDLMWGLRVLSARDGTQVSEQVRRAIEAWVQKHRADQQQVHRAFDEFETDLQAAFNGDRREVGNVTLPAAFGPRLGSRRFATLTEGEMDVLDGFAAAASRETKAYRQDWLRAVQQRKRGRTAK